jgi:hypothetical protein
LQQHDWLGRFQQFVARKTRRAPTALLPPYRTELDDPDANALTVGNACAIPHRSSPLRGLEVADTMLFNLPAVRVLLLTIPSAAEQMSQPSTSDLGSRCY